jgi:hypothetical protein
MSSGGWRSGGRIHEQQNFDVEQSDLGWIQMSDNIWRVEALALNGLQFPGVSSMIICDCGNQIFKIGTAARLFHPKRDRDVSARAATTAATFSSVQLAADCSSPALIRPAK